jgi:hypothetical protein
MIYKGVCINGLDGNFVVKADLSRSATSKLQCVLQFEDEKMCEEFLTRNKQKLFSMSVSLVAVPEVTSLMEQSNYSQTFEREFSFGGSCLAN